MENLNIDQYLNKVDGNTLPASEWNACLTAVQAKVNELVSSVSNEDIIVNSIDTKLIKTTNSNNRPVSGISRQLIVGGNRYVFTNGILTDVVKLLPQDSELPPEVTDPNNPGEAEVYPGDPSNGEVYPGGPRDGEVYPGDLGEAVIPGN